MNNFFIILAAGNGARFKKKQKKQYTIYKNLKIFEHSVFKAIKSKLLVYLLSLFLLVFLPFSHL